jgi:HD-like signal output (HDOD) protein
MSISRVWSHAHGPGWSTARFNLHSVACGVMADLLAQRVRVNYPEGAFAAGLFHDLGRLLIAVGLPAEHAEIQGIYLEGVGLSLDRCEENIIGVTHAELAAEALATWNLPADIQAAVRFHHDPNYRRRGQRVESRHRDPLRR